jgi:hypothetical protein
MSHASLTQMQGNLELSIRGKEILSLYTKLTLYGHHYTNNTYGCVSHTHGEIPVTPFCVLPTHASLMLSCR